jgi:hypothetical protein
MIAALTALTFNDTTAAVGTTYIYAVTARSNPGESARSATDTGVRVAGFMTADNSKPTDPGDGSYSPNTTEAVTEEPEIAPMGVQRYLQVIAITRDAAQACDVEADAQPTAGDTTEGEATDGESADPTNAPAIIDLDQNGEPDLCQLRRGDLDLNGRLDEADLALLLTMIGEEPVLEPGASYEYTSGVPLPTPSGIMMGSYGMVTPGGERFDIDIPPFSLDGPETRRTVN